MSSTCIAFEKIRWYCLFLLSFFLLSENMIAEFWSAIIGTFSCRHMTCQLHRWWMKVSLWNLCPRYVSNIIIGLVYCLYIPFSYLKVCQIEPVDQTVKTVTLSVLVQSNFQRPDKFMVLFIFLSLFIIQILNALLKILASQPPLSILIQWHTGWFFRKLLISQGKILNELNFKLFNVRTHQSFGHSFFLPWFW